MMHASVRFFALFAAAIVLISCGKAQAAHLAPAAGNYDCYTFQISLQLHERQRASVATLETDWRMVYERRTDIVPAGFSLSLDGKRNYKIAGTTSAGTYAFNAKTGAVDFAGDASEMGLRSYFIKNGLYIFQFQPNEDVFYHCEFDSGNRAIGAVKNTAPEMAQPKPETQAGYNWPTASTRPIKAQDITGRFEGSYVCGQGETRLSLDLKPDPDGLNMTGVFSFGGTKADPLGSYFMRGLVGDARFYLMGESWIKQPEGYEMAHVDGYRATDGRLSGDILAKGCSGFTVSRK